MPDYSIKTTAGEIFTSLEYIDLARLIFKRFGNYEDATHAWRRLHQNNTTVAEFSALVEDQEHTSYCRGECQIHAHDRDNELDEHYREKEGK